MAAFRRCNFGNVVVIAPAPTRPQKPGGDEDDNDQ